MTKKEIVISIADKTGIDRNAVSIVVEKFMEEIVSSLVKGETVNLRLFGSFSTKKRAAKPARNIRDNTTITVPEHYVPFFKASDYFKQEVSESRDSSSKEESSNMTFDKRKNKHG